MRRSQTALRQSAGLCLSQARTRQSPETFWIGERPAAATMLTKANLHMVLLVPKPSFADGGDSSDEDPAQYLRDLKRRVQFSDRSQRVLDDSDHLLKSIRSRRTLPPPIAGSCSMSTIPTSLDRKGDQSMQDRAERTLQRSRRSLSPEECAESAST